MTAQIMARAPVGLGARSYVVEIGAGLIDTVGAQIAALKPGARVAIVTDETVGGLYGARVLESCAAAGLAAHAITVAPGEQTKSFAGLEQVCLGLLDAGLERRDCVVALGGGVIGDLAGLAAGLLKRGVDYVQVPTTLLAQVDSSVGGKTAIDAPHGKNLIGLFHQPRRVIADLAVLDTLPDREIGTGLAEVVKYGLINDAAFFDRCVAAAASLRARDRTALAWAVDHSVLTKAAIVAADEIEAGDRALLNLGHTFGHAIEALTGMDGGVLHGEAVAIGMALAFEFSAMLGLCDPREAVRVKAGLEQLGLDWRVPEAVRVAGAGAMIAAMAQDKKNEAGRLTLILAHGVGRAFVAKDAPIDRLRSFLESGLG